MSNSGKIDQSRELILNRDYWLNYPRGLSKIITGPFRWNTNQWKTFGVAAGATGALFLADEGIRDWWQEDLRSRTTDDISDIFEPFGNTRYVAIGSTALYGTGLLLDDTRYQETGLLAMQGLILSSLTLESIKLISHRHRPGESPGNAHNWDGPGTEGRHKSFASGHSAKAFMLAGILSSQYPDNRPLKITACTIATLTALSRINDEMHWASDILAGAVLGYSIGRLVAAMSPFRVGSRVTLLPMSEQNSKGMKIAIRF